MNLSSTFSFNKNELLTGLVAFFFIALLTLGSRQIRLTSSDAIIIPTEVTLILDEKTGVPELIKILDSLSVDYQASELEWSSGMLGWRTFRKGNYVLSGEYSYESILSKLARGIQDPVPVVVLPGITVDRFSEIASSVLNFEKSDMEKVFEDSLFLEDLGFTREQLFGRMLPETYLVYWTTTPKELVRRILREFDDLVVDRFSKDIKKQDHTVNDVITMASIVEWEANIEDEKPIISGLYWNRLNRRMLLQADPTINYALGERRRLLFEDYQFDHPFNTYRNKGLPPGPITNPSLSTIEATVYPQNHDYIYMVANPEGGHIFTRTFEEHQVESEKWRRWLRQQYRIKRQQEAEALND